MMLRSRLCIDCLRLLRTVRSFQTTSEAISYERTISLVNTPTTPSSELSWLAYLSTPSDLDIAGTLAEVPPGELPGVVRMMLTMRLNQELLSELKGLVGEQVAKQPNNKPLVFAGLLLHSSLQLNQVKKLVKGDRLYRHSRIADTVEAFQETYQTDPIPLAFLWMKAGRNDLVHRLMEDKVLKTHEECFLMLKGLITYQNISPALVKSVCYSMIRCEDLALLAAQLSIYQPLNFIIIEHLLMRDPRSTSDKVTKFIEYLSQMEHSPTEMFNILMSIRIPESVMSQVLLNHHHSSSDSLVYTTYLTLSPQSMLDLAPLLSHLPSSSPPHAHISSILLAYLRRGYSELFPSLLSRVSAPTFVRNNLREEGWVLRVLESGDHVFTPEDYSVLVRALPTYVRAELLRTCCSAQSNLPLVKQVVLRSLEGQTLENVLLKLLQTVGDLSAGDYVDDCLLATCQDLPGRQVLELVRYLSDHEVLSKHQESLWTIVGHGNKEGGSGIALELLEELYSGEEGYFSCVELSNMAHLVQNGLLERELRRREGELAEKKRRLKQVIEHKAGRVKQIMQEDLSVLLLKEDGFLSQIAGKFGVHACVAVLDKCCDIQKCSNELVELVRQLEAQGDIKSMQTFLLGYGYLLPPNIRQYAERLVLKKGKLRDQYEHFTQTQMYLYSYLAHKPVDEPMSEVLENLELSTRDECLMLMIRFVLYPSGREEVRRLLKSGRFTGDNHIITKNDRKLIYYFDREVLSDTINKTENGCIALGHEEDQVNDNVEAVV